MQTCSFVEKIGQKAAYDGLVANNEDVLLPLQFHDDRFQSRHQIFVGFATWVPVTRAMTFIRIPFNVSPVNVNPINSSRLID